MLDTYTLYLDETKPNTSFPVFTLSGVVIRDSDYQNVSNNVELVKQNYFNNTQIVLHEMDMRKRGKSFSSFDKNVIIRFFQDFKNIYNELITVLGVTIKIDQLSNLYNESDRNDIYFIALQIILENYSHFLISNNGIGKIVVESTDDAHDQKLRVLFYKLLYTGTLFYTNKVLQDRLLTIDFKRKADNINGLQIADFVSNPLARQALNRKQKSNSLFEVINKRVYKAGCLESSRFGHKIIP